MTGARRSSGCGSDFSPTPAPDGTTAGAPAAVRAGSAVFMKGMAAVALLALAALPVCAEGPTAAGAATTADDSVSRLDTARGVDYLSAIAKDVVLELNRVRADPKGYAERHLVPRRSRFDGRVYRMSERVRIRTHEGVAALEEAIEALRGTAPRPVLQPSAALSRAARDHVRDSGPGGRLGHAGSDGSSPRDRIERHGQWQHRFGENIAYGISDAREIVIQLLIDDGVPDRGHRRNILEPGFRVVGTHFGPHAQYERMLVMDFAGGMAEPEAALD